MGGLPSHPSAVFGGCIGRGEFGWRSVSLHQSDRKSERIPPTASSISHSRFPLWLACSLAQRGRGLIAHASLPCSWTLGCKAIGRYSKHIQAEESDHAAEVWHCLDYTRIKCAASQYRCSLFSLTGLTWAICTYCHQCKCLDLNLFVVYSATEESICHHIYIYIYILYTIYIFISDVKLLIAIIRIQN